MQTMQSMQIVQIMQLMKIMQIQSVAGNVEIHRNFKMQEELLFAV